MKGINKGESVRFGRSHGRRSLGVVDEVTPMGYRVRTESGAVWNVPEALVRSARTGFQDLILQFAQIAK